MGQVGTRLYILLKSLLEGMIFITKLTKVALNPSRLHLMKGLNKNAIPVEPKSVPSSLLWISTPSAGLQSHYTG